MSVLSDEKYLEMAHRMATTYRHDADGPGRHHYGFHRHTLLDFARAVAEAAIAAAPPAAPVVTTEEGRHCGDPDCVPCRDPAEPAAPVVPECPFPCGWRKLHELMVKDAAWVSRELQAYPDEPLPEHLPQIVFVNHDRALRVVRAMLAAAPAPSQEPKA